MRFKLVKLSYGNHFDDVISFFSYRGWGIHNINKSETDTYITFIGGLDFKEIKTEEFKFPNASMW